MRKGLILTLLLGALVLGMGTTANAASPIIDEIPVVIISDLESNSLTQDNNVFAFSNAWDFADYATDADTAAGSLQWSFYYDGSLSGNVGDIQINGIASLILPGEDPTAPAAKNIRTGASASYREVALSPGSASSYPAPAPGTPGTIPGFGSYSDIVGDLTVTYYVSDGTAYDFDESFVFTVDTNPGDTTPGDQVVEGPPVLTFTAASLTGWTFADGGGGTPNFFATGATSGTTGGLQIIHPATPGTSILGQTYAFWLNGALSGFNFTAGNLYLARFGATWSAAQGGGDQNRLLAIAAPASGMDLTYFLNVADAAHPTQAVGGNTYLAYYAPNAADGSGQHTALFDSVDSGARTTTLTSLETASSTKSAFTGSAQSVAAATFASNFTTTNWAFTNFGPALGVVLGSAAGTITGGNLVVTDTDSATAGQGGAAEWAFGGAGQGSEGDLTYATGGGLYYNTWTATVANGGGAGFPQPVFRARNKTAAHGADALVRGTSTLFDTLAGGSNSYDNFWTAADYSATGGGDMVLALGLQNLQGGQTDVGGTVTVTGLGTWLLTSDDPNLP